MRHKHKIYTFDSPVIARKIRIHPIDAFDQYGPTNHLMIRVSPIMCNVQGREKKFSLANKLIRKNSVICVIGKCPNEKVHCQMSKWSNWGSCQCNGDYCVETRVREVHRYASCGGTPCEHTREKRKCSIPSGKFAFHFL